MRSRPEERPRPLLHLTVFGALCALAATFPPAGAWPWVWLIPIAGYVCVTVSIPSLRRSVSAPEPGKISQSDVGIIVVAALITIGALAGYQYIAEPQLGQYLLLLPGFLREHPVAIPFVFPILNACCEEFVFRGLVYDAAKAVNGEKFAVVTAGILFGIGHLRGYPPGVIGTALAMIFGVMMGALRVRTGGLLAPILVHVVADTAIATMILRH